MSHLPPPQFIWNNNTYSAYVSRKRLNDQSATISSSKQGIHFQLDDDIDEDEFADSEPQYYIRRSNTQMRQNDQSDDNDQD